ncbi:MAG TPA: hypothetical protein PLY06_02105, partial [Anaerolineaceae bacterium]|nr:hypothetical protein [Anaerolineaceae bacterium]
GPATGCPHGETHRGSEAAAREPEIDHRVGNNYIFTPTDPTTVVPEKDRSRALIFKAELFLFSRQKQKETVAIRAITANICISNEGI